jgi:hypothetical protein
MIITIKHKPDIKGERRKKLSKLDKSKINDYVSYDWTCMGESDDEDVYDIQLFSLSITKNLLEQQFFTNELGKVNNDILNMLELKETIKNIKVLMFSILEKKRLNKHQ